MSSQVVVRALQELRREVVKTCKKCKGHQCNDCLGKFHIYVKCAQAGIPIKFWKYRLKDFIWDPKASQKVRKYISKIHEARIRGLGLYLWGGGGTGKSLAASLILKHAIKGGYQVVFTSLEETINMSNDTMYDKDAREKFQRILSVDFLVFDDIDKTFISSKSEYIQSRIDTIFRKRANSLLPTILTSNLSKQELLSKLDTRTSTTSAFKDSLRELFYEHTIKISFLESASKRRKELATSVQQFIED